MSAYAGAGIGDLVVSEIVCHIVRPSGPSFLLKESTRGDFSRACRMSWGEGRAHV